MKKTYFQFAAPVVFLSLLFAACSGNKQEKKQEQKPDQEKPQAEVQAPKSHAVIGGESELLLKYLDENGNYIKSKEFPSLIKASIVHDNLGPKQLVIDIRDSKSFSGGHIKGAVNKKFEELPAYFQKGIKPFEFERIIVVSDDGQLASYTTSLLRLLGYGNIYAMRWGMSAWNNSFAKDGWLKGVSGKYESSLETKANERDIAGSLPELKTGLKTGEEITLARIKKLFEEGTGGVLITADEVFANPNKYFILNFERKDKYEDGHIPGAVRCKPESTLGYIDEMGSIPVGKTVVVYCGTGHNSGFATAYLRLFGYNALTLKYGNNGFMHDKMVKQRAALSWLPFGTEDVNNFEVVK